MNGNSENSNGNSDDVDRVNANATVDLDKMDEAGNDVTEGGEQLDAKQVHEICNLS